MITLQSKSEEREVYEAQSKSTKIASGLRKKKGNRERGRRGEKREREEEVDSVKGGYQQVLGNSKNNFNDVGR